MTTAMYVLLLMCISNAGKCEMFQHGDAYVVTGYYKNHAVGCKPYDARRASCYWSEDVDADWKRMSKLPEASTGKLAAKTEL